jgi:hypothetical protein
MAGLFRDEVAGEDGGRVRRAAEEEEEEDEDSRVSLKLLLKPRTTDSPSSTGAPSFPSALTMRGEGNGAAAFLALVARTAAPASPSTAARFDTAAAAAATTTTTTRAKVRILVTAHAMAATGIFRR